jgi:hypothetical protein
MPAAEAHCLACGAMRTVTFARRAGIVSPPTPPALVVCHRLECNHRVHAIEGAEVDGRVDLGNARECGCPWV